MKLQSKPQVIAMVGDKVQTTPFTPEQYRQLNPGVWAVMARIRARVEREAKERPAPALVS